MPGRGERCNATRREQQQQIRQKVVRTMILWPMDGGIRQWLTPSIVCLSQWYCSHIGGANTGVYRFALAMIAAARKNIPSQWSGEVTFALKPTPVVMSCMIKLYYLVYVTMFLQQEEERARSAHVYTHSVSLHHRSSFPWRSGWDRNWNQIGYRDRRTYRSQIELVNVTQLHSCWQCPDQCPPLKTKTKIAVKTSVGDSNPRIIAGYLDLQLPSRCRWYQNRIQQESRRDVCH